MKDEKGAVILNLQDAFELLKEGKRPEELSELTATITTGSPMIVWGTNTYTVVFSDRLYRSKNITCNGRFKIEPLEGFKHI